MCLQAYRELAMGSSSEGDAAEEGEDSETETAAALAPPAPAEPVALDCEVIYQRLKSAYEQKKTHDEEHGDQTASEAELVQHVSVPQFGPRRAHRVARTRPP